MSVNLFLFLCNKIATIDFKNKRESAELIRYKKDGAEISAF